MDVVHAGDDSVIQCNQDIASFDSRPCGNTAGNDVHNLYGLFGKQIELADHAFWQSDRGCSDAQQSTVHLTMFD